MKKNLVISAFFLSCLSNFAWSGGSKLPYPIGVSTIYNVIDIGDVAFFVDALRGDGYQSHEILVVFDIDDTLVDKHFVHNKGVYKARHNAVEVVAKLYHENFNLLASSANISPLSSFEKLNDIGLLPAFGVNRIPKQIKFSYTKVARRDSDGKEDEFEYYREGNVIGARKAAHSAVDPQTTFVRKAIATHIRLEGNSQVKRIIFVDDKKPYIKQYKKDLRTYALFPQVELLDCFDLVSIASLRKLLDFSYEPLLKRAKISSIEAPSDFVGSPLVKRLFESIGDSAL